MMMRKRRRISKRESALVVIESLREKFSLFVMVS